MNRVEYKNLEETLKKLLSNKVDDDAKEGNKLLQKCGLNEKQQFCSNEHKSAVIKYISKIEKEYMPFIKLYILSLGKIVTGEQAPINCKSLSIYVNIVNNIKKTKDLDENLDYLIKLMSGGKIDD
jgi:hypothetical protein